MKLEGSLDLFPLRELIDMVVYSSVTGVLNLYDQTKAAHLYFEDGRLYHITDGELTGAEALGRIFANAKLNFAFISDLHTEENTVWGDIDTIVQTAAAEGERWQKIGAAIPSLKLVPRLCSQPEQLRYSVNPLQYPLIEAIDGQHDLEELSTELGWLRIDVCEAVAELVKDRCVELRSSREPIRPGPAPQTEGARGRRDPVRGGLFDRLRPLAETEPAGDAPAQLEHRPPPIKPEDSILQLLRGQA